MLRRVIWTVVAFPIGLVLVTLAVSNGHRVRLVLDPFRPDAPVLSVVLPFYGFLIGALLVGVIHITTPPSTTPTSSAPIRKP